MGITGNLQNRLEWHNCAQSGYEIRYRPWSLVVSMEFQSTAEAVRFEKYLKSGSGRAFAKRHFGATFADGCEPVPP